MFVQFSSSNPPSEKENNKTGNHRKFKRLKPKRYYIRKSGRRGARIANKADNKNCKIEFVIAYSSKNVNKDQYLPHDIQMDTNSYMIGLDTHASKCISNSKRQFIGPIRPAKYKKIDGIDGSLEVKGVGTVEWKIQDDQNRMHTIRILGTLYVPKMECCILSPQHWIKEAKDHHPRRNGTTTVNLEEGMLMMWNQRQYTKLVQTHQDSTSIQGANNIVHLKQSSMTHLP